MHSGLSRILDDLALFASSIDRAREGERDRIGRMAELVVVAVVVAAVVVAACVRVCARMCAYVRLRRCVAARAWRRRGVCVCVCFFSPYIEPAKASAIVLDA